MIYKPRSVVALTLLASCLQISALAQQRVPITVTISTPTPVAKSGTEIRIDVSVKNTSDQTIPILKALGFDGQTEFVNHPHVFDAKGEPVAWIAGRHSGLSRKTITVEPGKSEDDFMILSKLYDMTKPGAYKVVVQHELEHFGVHHPDERFQFVRSNELQITVTE